MATSNIIINNLPRIDYNFCDTSDWTTDLSGSTNDFIEYNFSNRGSNNREEIIGPYGSNVFSWKSYSITNGPRLGFNQSHTLGTNLYEIDVNKKYRMSIWVKRTVSSSSGERLYFSPTANNGTTAIAVENYNTGDDITYIIPIINFTTLNTQIPVNEWRLLVCIIWPTGTSGSSTGETGIYDTTGLKIADYSESRWKSTTLYAGLRYYPNYDGTSGNTIYAAYPRLDVIDGTEPSIQELINGTYLQASKIGLVENTDNNLYDISDWGILTTGDTSMFNAYNTEAENYRKQDINPWGVNDWVWSNSGLTVGNVNCGGWNDVVGSNNMVSIDHTKSYRCSMWVKRKVKSTAGLFYFGYNVYNSAYSRINSIRLEDSLAHNNFYFATIPYYVADTYIPEDQWRLLVYYIRPSTWTGTTATVDAGIYDVTGVKVYNAIGNDEFKFSGSTTYITLRSFCPHNADINGVYYNYLPRIDCLDGTEPSIQQLLSGTPETNLSVLQEPVIDT